MRAFLFCFLFALCSQALSKENQINVIAIDNDPPFSYLNGDESKGLLVEVFHAVAKQLPQYKFHLSHAPFSAIEARKLPKDTHGFLGAYFRINEWDDMYPYSYPIYHEQMCIVCANRTDGMNVPLSWPGDYSNTKLGSVRGYSGWLTYGADARLMGSLNVFEFPNPRLALLGIQNGVVDCALFEKTVFRALTQELVKNEDLPTEHDLYIASDLKRDSVHLGYFTEALNAENKKIVKEFDQAFIKLLDSEQLAPIFIKYGVSH